MCRAFGAWLGSIVGFYWQGWCGLCLSWWWALPQWQASFGKGGGGYMRDMACKILEKGTMWPWHLRGPAGVCVMQVWGGLTSFLCRIALFWQVVACLWLWFAAYGGDVWALPLEGPCPRMGWCCSSYLFCVYLGTFGLDTVQGFSQCCWIWWRGCCLTLATVCRLWR